MTQPNRAAHSAVATRRSTVSALTTSGLLTLITLISACGLVPTRPWSYENPPRLKDLVVIPANGVQCTSLSAAKFMAVTGFFSPDCSDRRIDSGRARVEELTHHTINGVSMCIIRTTIDFETYWIPLPDHNWI